jgi:hypothetical protein
MDENKPMFALPVEAFEIAGDPDSETGVAVLKAGGNAVAAVMSSEQLSDFVSQALVWAAQAKHPHRNQGPSTTQAPLTTKAVRASGVAIAANPADPRLVVLAFPVGALMLSFEVPLAPLANALAAHIAGRMPEEGPPKPH